MSADSIPQHSVAVLSRLIFYASLSIHDARQQMTGSRSAPAASGLLKLAFEIGTLPAILFISVTFSKLSTKAREYMLKGTVAAMLIMSSIAMTRDHGIFHGRTRVKQPSA